MYDIGNRMNDTLILLMQNKGVNLNKVLIFY